MFKKHAKILSFDTKTDIKHNYLLKPIHGSWTFLHLAY